MVDNKKEIAINKNKKKDVYGVLTEDKIRSRLEKDVCDLNSLVITPFPDEIDKDSIDLRLGSYFFIPRNHRSPCFIPGLTDPHHLYREQYIPIGSYLVLPAHHTVLGATLEYIKLPVDISGEILTKSSWARTFIAVETAPWIHPLYRGCLTLEIANASNTPVILYPGIKIAQLILLTTTTISYPKKDVIEGTYIGPVRPEPAKINPPEKALERLGVKAEDIQHPYDEFRESKLTSVQLPDSTKEETCKTAEKLKKKGPIWNLITFVVVAIAIVIFLIWGFIFK